MLAFAKYSLSYRWGMGLAVFVCLLLSLVYLSQMASPLRLHGDSIGYLLQAERILDGRGFQIGEGKSAGYPIVIALPVYFGLSTPWVFIALNLVCLGFGLAAACCIFRTVFGFDRVLSIMLVDFTLLCWVVVKHVTLPLSDVPYFGLSMLGLASLSLAEKQKGVGLWFLAIVFVIASIFLRVVGIALIPAFIWAWLRRLQSIETNRIFGWRGRVSVTLGVGIGLILGVILIIGYLPSTLLEFKVKGGLIKGLLTTWGFRLKEFSELAVNLPLSKAPDTFSSVSPIIGGVALAAVFLGGWLRWRDFRAVDIYLASYLLILLGWPSKDARFWLPVFPLLMSWFVTTLFYVSKLARIPWCLRAYGLAYLLLGVAALAYSTRISFSGSRFPELYGDGTLRPAYQAAWGRPSPGEMSELNKVALHLLQRFNQRASE